MSTKLPEAFEPRPPGPKDKQSSEEGKAYGYMMEGYNSALEATGAKELWEALQPIVAFCDDPDGSNQRETLAEGLSRLLPAARATLSKSNPSNTVVK